MSVSCGRGAHFQKVVFLCLGLIFVECVGFWDASGNHSGTQSGSKMALKFN